MNNSESSTIEFRNVYSHPGDMESVVNEFTVMFKKIEIFFLPIEINIFEGLGWVLIEFLNNAVRSPVSLAMNKGITDLNKINFYTDIIIRKMITSDFSPGVSKVDISVMNSGEYSEDVISSIQQILSGRFSLLDCEERFLLKGSYTGNGGMGILLSKKQVENYLGGTLSLSWHDGYYDFAIRYTTDKLL